MGLSKRAGANRELLEGKSAFSVQQAFELLSEMKKVNFKRGESVDVAINLGVDISQSEQQVRGVTVLPHGSGREVRIAVFAQGDDVDAAKKAGADKVGLEDLAKEIKGGKMDFDVLIATPDTMRSVGELAQVLGPKGLMPNPKNGTVAKDVAQAVSDAKKGRIQFRSDKGGVVHGCVGNMNFKVEQIQENLEALLTDLQKQKPASAKGAYIKKVTLSSTMSPGLALDCGTLNLK